MEALSPYACYMMMDNGALEWSFYSITWQVCIKCVPSASTARPWGHSSEQSKCALDMGRTFTVVKRRHISDNLSFCREVCFMNICPVVQWRLWSSIWEYVGEGKTWQPTLVLSPGKSHGEGPDGLQSIGLQRVGHYWSDFTHTHQPECVQ